MTAIILTGLVFKEGEENYNLGIKEIENLVKNFFDSDGFPLSKIPMTDLFFKIFYFCKEIIKDSKIYSEFLEDIIEKNISCINFIKTPDDSLPLFNGATSLKISQIEKYLENKKSNNKKII